MASYRAAVIGAGNIGKNHAGIYQRHPDVELLAICDMNQDKADATAKQFEVPAFYSVNDLLKADLGLDVVNVCTAGVENGSHHYEPTMAVLNAGIPVLGEKPICNTIPEAREMVNLARQKNLPYAINLNHRFTPAAERAKQWLDEGRLGEVNLIDMRMWINNKNESSPYFHIRALHPHSLDIMRHFGGDVARVHCFFKKGQGRETWSNLHMNLQYENGVIGHLLGSYDGGGPNTPWGLETCEVIGQDARFIIHDACEKLEFQPRGNRQYETYGHPGNMGSFGETFQSRLEAWIEDLKAGVAPEHIRGSGEEALKAQLIIEAAIESWENSTVVDVPTA